MQYYYNQDGQQIGPVDLQTLRATGIMPNTMVWHEGMPNWQPASSLPELSDLFFTGAKEAPNYAGAPQQPNQNGIQTPFCPPTYLALSIIVTILCCLPFGIVAIVNAAGVSDAFDRGDYTAAERKSRAARSWSIWSIVASAIGILIYVVFLLVFGLAALGLEGLENL